MLKELRRIFISSTFRDMQAERDLVQQSVIPMLRAKAREYGENIDAVDLRWGVDTTELDSDEGSKKVLSVCFDEIDKSKPYMLIFLGNRYGWIPNEDIVKKAIKDREVYFDTSDLHKSITALEIEYGALSGKNGNKENSIICIRKEDVLGQILGGNKSIYEDMDEESKNRLLQLKEKILSRFANRIIYYTCTWDEEKQKLTNFVTEEEKPLADAIAEAFLKLFEKEWLVYKALTEPEREAMVQDGFCREKVNSFRGREAFATGLLQKVCEENAAKTYVLSGPVGSGKSAVMAKLARRLKEKGCDVFYTFGGTTKQSSSPINIVVNIVDFLEKIAKPAPEERQKFTSYKAYMEHLCDMVCAQKQIYILVDGIDFLHKTEYLDNLFFLPAQRENLKIVVSSAEEIFFDSAHAAKREIVEMPVLDEQDKLAIIGETYKQIQQAILQKKASDMPLYISICMARLKMMDFEELFAASSEDAIIRTAVWLMDGMADNVPGAALQLLKEALSRNSAQADSLMEAVRMIAVSRNGLREDDLVKIFALRSKSLNRLDLSWLLKYVDFLFAEKSGGLMDFSHKNLKDAVLAENFDKQQYEEILHEYMGTLAADDVVFQSEAMYYATKFADVELGRRVCVKAAEASNDTLDYSIRESSYMDDGAFLMELVPNVMMPTENLELLITFFCTVLPKIYSMTEKDNRILIHIVEKIEGMVKLAEFVFSLKHNETDNVAVYKRMNPNASEKELEDIRQSEERTKKMAQGVEIPEGVREQYAVLFQHMAERMSEMGIENEAKYYSDVALRIAPVKHGDDNKNGLDPLTFATSLLTKAKTLERAGKYDEALKYYISSAEHIAADGPIQSLEVSDVYLAAMSGIYTCRNVLQQFKEAETDYATIMDFWTHLKDSKERNRYGALMANVYLAKFRGARTRKEYAVAKDAIMECIALEEEVRRVSNSLGSGLAYAYSMAAELYLELDEEELGTQYMKKCHDLYVALNEQRSDKFSLGDLQYSANQLAKLAMKHGDEQQAVAYYLVDLDCCQKLLRMEPDKEYLHVLNDRIDSVAGLAAKCGMTRHQWSLLGMVADNYVLLAQMTSDVENYEYAAKIYLLAIRIIEQNGNKPEDKLTYARMAAACMEKFFEEKKTAQVLAQCATAMSIVSGVYKELGDREKYVRSLHHELQFATMLAQHGNDKDTWRIVLEINEEIAGLSIDLYQEKMQAQEYPDVLIYAMLAADALLAICLLTGDKQYMGNIKTLCSNYLALADALKENGVKIDEEEYQHMQEILQE